MNQTTFDIILCTYNGEKYLAEQLNSIANQCQLPEMIIWSDDGSTDATANIVTEFCKTNNLSLKAINGPQQGPAANFLQAMQHTTADYAFFCDQDDVWLPNKVELFIAQMNHSKTPHLIFSDCLVWDGKQKQESFWQVEGIAPTHIYRTQNIMFRNVVQGASMALNRALIDKTLIPTQCMMHDWWLALSANAFANISIIETPTMLYRQHASNAVGANTKRSLQAKHAASLNISKQARHFFILHKAELKNHTRSIYAAFNNANTIVKKLTFLANHRPIRSNIKKTITLWLSLVATK